MLPDIVVIASGIGLIALASLILWSKRAPTLAIKRKRMLITTAVTRPLSCCMFSVAMSGCERAVSATTESDYVYAPGGRNAFRVTDSSQGALGGSTYITLYSWHGLIRNLIYVGDYASTRAAIVSWNGSEAVTVRYYEGGLHPSACKQTRFVSVHCESIPFQPYTK